MALTDRVKIVGNILIVTNCDGTKEEYTIDCGCAPTTGNPGTTPPPMGDICAQSNWIAYAVQYVNNYFASDLDQQENNFVGRNIAIASTALALKLPVSPWAFYMSGFIAAENPSAAENRANLFSVTWVEQSTHDTLTCIIHDILEQNGGVFSYEAFTSRMDAQGWYAGGVVVATIPIGIFMEYVYLLSNGKPPFERIVDVGDTDCEICNNVPEPTSCPGECLTFTCNRLVPIPMTANAYDVTGYSQIIDFTKPGDDGCWFGENFSPLRIDMGTPKCLRKVRVVSYTPCPSGGGLRAAHYRVKLDDVSISEFKCSQVGNTRYIPCNDTNPSLAPYVIDFEFPSGLWGRRIEIVPLREQMTIIQVDVVTCT